MEQHNRLDVSDVLRDAKLSIAEKSEMISKRLRRIGGFRDLANQLQFCTTEEDFNEVWEQVYDRVDRNPHVTIL